MTVAPRYPNPDSDRPVPHPWGAETTLPDDTKEVPAMTPPAEVPAVLSFPSTSADPRPRRLAVPSWAQCLTALLLVALVFSIYQWWTLSQEVRALRAAIEQEQQDRQDQGARSPAVAERERLEMARQLNQELKELRNRAAVVKVLLERPPHKTDKGSP